MSWILDIALLVVFGFCIWHGYHKGMIKALSGILAFLLATAVCALLNTTVAELVYKNAVEPPVISAVEEALGEGGTLAEGADKALQAMPGFVRSLLGKTGITSGNDVVSKLNGQSGATDYAHQISDQIVRPVALKLLQAICSLLLFLVSLIVARVLLRVLNIVAKLPLLKQMNKALGSVAGVISGILWVLFFAGVLQIIAAVSAPDALINQTVLEQTQLLSRITGLNPLSGSLQELLNI